jgi:hypothetical protein
MSPRKFRQTWWYVKVFVENDIVKNHGRIITDHPQRAPPFGRPLLSPAVGESQAHNKVLLLNNLLSSCITSYHPAERILKQSERSRKINMAFSSVFHSQITLLFCTAKH